MNNNDNPYKPLDFNEEIYNRWGEDEEEDIPAVKNNEDNDEEG